MKSWAIGWCHRITQKRESLESAEVTMVWQIIWLRNITEEESGESTSFENYSHTYAELCLQIKSDLKANIWVRYKLTNLTLTHGFIMWRMAIHTGCWQHSPPKAPVNKANSHPSVYLSQRTSTGESQPKSWQPSW